jgi:hypothetical protein
MPVPIVCSCSAKLRVADHLAGLRVQCPECQSVHAVPGGSNASSNGNGRAIRGLAGLPPVADVDTVLAESGYSDSESDRLRTELEAGERLAWAGKTAPGYHMSLLKPMVGAAALFTVFAVQVIATLFVAGSKAPLYMIIPCILISLAALAALIGTPFYYQKRERATAYAITDRRVMLWEIDPFLRPKFHSLGPEDIVRFARWAKSEDPDTLGSLVFTRLRVFRFGRFKANRPLGFLYLKNYIDVERKMREHLIDPYTDRLLN